MRRREFVRGLGVLAGTAIVGTVVATEAFARREATVEQVVDDGVLQPQSRLTVYFTRRVDRVDSERITVSVPVVDPLDGREARRTVDVLEATGSGRRFDLVVDGPVSRGAVVSFGSGSLVLDGRPVGTFSHALDGQLDTPERATQWFKAYEPTRAELFAPHVYGTEVSSRAPLDEDPRQVRQRLAAHLDRFVTRDRLSTAEREAVLERFDDPTVRALFVDAEGEFDPELLAGVLANAGTIAQGLDAVLVDGKNGFDHPYTVRRRETPSGGLMEVLVEGGEPTIAVDSRLDGEPFEVLAPLFAHEGFHQDLDVVLHEEVIATYLETLVWAEHLLANPELARRETLKTRRANTMLLLALNSGRRSFPGVGLHRAPHRQRPSNAAPGSVEPLTDFASAVEARYLQTPPGASPGVPYTRGVIERVTGAPATAVDYDGETLALLDRRTRLFSDEELLTLLGALELQPAETDPVPTLPRERTTDPVDSADAEIDVGRDTDGTDWTSGRHRFEHPAGCGTCLRAAD